MSDSKSSGPKPARVSRTAGPQAAMEALLGDTAFDPLRRALWLDALDQRLRPSLPPSLAGHARLANLDGGRLVYVVDAPVWRAKLRLVAPDILDAARSLGLGVAELVVKTTTHPIHPEKRAEPKAKPMSAAAKEALQAALASLKDPGKTGPEDS
ncbi:DUF721 domain-containing protein [Lysobacter sp. KIS68-7]|uniref:DUF721 domain-containing protein n=1 Tax=Lysobacter sp. KIS68-7 TaxID=2904252 RepID=UPI001E2D14D1|nr:DUF721 domain-containing protein [Lysobacter sp. KIS68-7]UHQ21037.1 DUF721 domain-containing protein [Lysobacter sp. KIS68-7]